MCGLARRHAVFAAPSAVAYATFVLLTLDDGNVPSGMEPADVPGVRPMADIGASCPTTLAAWTTISIQGWFPTGTAVASRLCWKSADGSGSSARTG